MLEDGYFRGGAGGLLDLVFLVAVCLDEGSFLDDREGGFLGGGAGMMEDGDFCGGAGGLLDRVFLG